jgi:hypothetical protein
MFSGDNLNNKDGDTCSGCVISVATSINFGVSGTAGSSENFSGEVAVSTTALCTGDGERRIGMGLLRLISGKKMSEKLHQMCSPWATKEVLCGL